MITLKRFRRLERDVREAGYGEAIEWSEDIVPPSSAEDFAAKAIYVICNSGMSNRTAIRIYTRCLSAVRAGEAAGSVFGHIQKARAIDWIWSLKDSLFENYQMVDDKVAMLVALPYIGKITSLHLFKNLGADTAKPDVHLERLARAENTTTAKLCQRLARQTGYRSATVDTILWRACERRILNSAVYEAEGWRAAYVKSHRPQIERPAQP